MRKFAIVAGLLLASSSVWAQDVEHPVGCPRRAFCGCGAAVEVFGRPIRELWLAANWFKFPRTMPAPGMVAVRRHHVFVLRAQVSNGNWIVYDANSGRGGTRVHERSLAGYQIVNPHG
jgi:hypothetical protein